MRRCLCILLANLVLLSAGCSAGVVPGEDPVVPAAPTEDPVVPSAPTEDLIVPSVPTTVPFSEPSLAPTTVYPTETTSPQEEPTAPKTYRIMFVGNSYTTYNQMPVGLFQNIAQSAGYDVEILSVAKGGYYLRQYMDPVDPYCKMFENALLRTPAFDYVVLQAQSVVPALDDPSDFYDVIRVLSGKIQDVGSQPILYCTWGRKTGHSTLDKYGWTNESMTWRLAAAYTAIGEELHLPVAYVGLAFYDVYTNQSEIDLYRDDLSHPSYAGSYLAAATLVAKIFNDDLSKVTFTGDLSESEARILLEAARKAVFETPSIPDEYHVSSEGIGNLK